MPCCWSAPFWQAFLRFQALLPREDNFFRLFDVFSGLLTGLFPSSVRVEHAIRLTVVSEESLSAAASRLGFSDISHFSRFFRNHTAVTQRLYRQGS